MTEMAERVPMNLHSDAAAKTRLQRRYARDRRFRRICMAMLVLAMSFLVILIGSIVTRGWTAFLATEMLLTVSLEPTMVDPDDPGDGNYRMLVVHALQLEFPGIESRSDLRALLGLVSNGALVELQNLVVGDPSLIGRTIDIWVPVASDIDMLNKGYIDRDVPEQLRRVDDRTIGWVDQLERDRRLRTTFNWTFFTTGDSREPELAGIAGAALGSFWMLLVTFLVAFPTGVAAAVYLEEFAPKRRWVDLIEVNINNLAAVPSIVFGLLGLAVFLNLMQLPRSAPLVGGLTLALMTLPTIIITTRAALKGVPPSIREAAQGIGASPVQTIAHHVLPLAMPRLMTGAIIGMAQALGETAPLLMIGMVAFIVDLPSGPMDPATALPVQIFLWADSPERGFVEKTSAAIMVLLGFLVVMNGIAVFLRQRFETRW